MDFNKKYHFIGIGGVSMSALAEFVNKKGAIVTGSDITKNSFTKRLQQQDIKIYFSHKAKNVRGADIVVYNSAIMENNAELIEAKRLSKRIISRGDFLGELSRQFSKTISISGSHGKTTTCAMISEIFVLAGKQPTVMIGGNSINLQSNFIMGKQEYLIVEACEYKNNFHKLSSDCGVVLNIDNDHLDFFKNKSEIKESFKIYEKNCNRVFKLDKKNNVVCSENGDTYSLKKVYTKSIFYSFIVEKNSEEIERIDLSVPHKHNCTNALFAFAVADFYSVPYETIKIALQNFKGTKRRFEFVGKLNGADVYLDYAHHPAEIRQTIITAKKLKKRVVTIFQPHTYSRTAHLFKDFIKVLKESDEIHIFKTFPAREKFDICGSARTLQKSLSQIKNCQYHSTYFSLKNSLKKNLNKNDVLLIVGAGDIENFIKHVHIK